MTDPIVNQNDPPVDPPVDPPIQDDLSTIFTADEIKAKKESVTQAKAEEERRAKLSPEDLKKEDDTKAEEAAKKAKEEADGKAPEKYADFKVPEGVEADKALLDETTPVFKEIGLSQASAQKMIDLFAEKILPAFTKKQMDAWEKQKADWHTETVASKEIKLDDKGANLDGNRVINSLFSPEEAKIFKADLVKYGLDNHPGINLLLTRAAKHLKEDTIDTKTKEALQPTPKTIEGFASRLYPDK
jgi:hypothetical protein